MSTGAGEGMARPSGSGSDLSAEISRRVTSILDAVEEEAARVRAEARAEAEAEIERARRQADELVRERQARLAELSDELVAKTEAILGRLDDAEPIYLRFERLIGALGDAAEKLAAETGEEQPVAGGGPAAVVVGPSAPADPTDPVDDGPEPGSEPYVPPRSSSFWRAVSAGSIAVTPPADRLVGSGQGSGSEDETPAPCANLDAARAAALQLATRGASREEVENHLRVMHDLADPGELLAETFAAHARLGRESRRDRT